MSSRPLLLLVMELMIGDKVFHTRLTGLRVPTKAVSYSDEGYVQLEYHQGGVRVVNHQCSMYSFSFGITPVSIHPCHLVLPDIPGDEGDCSPLRGGNVV